MSLFGSMTTAISGLNAQSRALGHISDNVANSQTVGYKRVDTDFTNFLTTSTPRLHAPGSVVARPDYRNSVQGTIEQSENPLALAVAGQGFFPVRSPVGEKNGLPEFDERQFFTRAGDFRLDKNGFLVNGSGYFLQGWPVTQTGAVDKTGVSPVRIAETVFNPIATSEINLSANLPATPNNQTMATQILIYDSLGTARPIDLTWTQNGPEDWTLTINAADDVNSPARGKIDLEFGFTSGNSVPSGTLGELTGATGSITGTTYAVDEPAIVNFNVDFGLGPQAVSLRLGTFGVSDGVTQYNGREYTVRSISQDGVPLGSYSSLTTRDNGDVVVNYDNGQSRVIARVPVVTFRNPDRLLRSDGQAFLRTIESGEAVSLDASTNGAGKLIGGSIERSNVDIATEFTKLILAQRAYTANTRVVTASDEMLQETINIRR